MSPRRYRIDTRKAAALETRQRIVEATVALHAEKGVLATTYAMIAERADVATPTVYNHFPNRMAILQACTAHVALEAPAFGPEIFATLRDTGTRLRALARSVLARHRYFEPWLRWAIHESAFIPELAAILQNERPLMRGMIDLALQPAFGSAPPAALAALCEALLDFRAAQLFWAEKSLSPPDVENALCEALAALAKQYRKTQKPRKARS